MNFIENHFGIVVHTKKISAKELNFHNYTTFNTSLSAEINEVLKMTSEHLCYSMKAEM